ncbi:Aste57867_7499 [Aphanomyces stellatus]|uniref:Aste57867_7499 protein n=1 Tax=Aphanomyces stellatus TaxID=120398 RepID=A0A485KID2_9STRA|nr:hypothetical protein As57867_007473 [Aphanomyces stellatus]VFT84408.1 Aste57867_7499 [Aphanomyces stellatus]
MGQTTSRTLALPRTNHAISLLSHLDSSTLAVFQSTKGESVFGMSGNDAVEAFFTKIADGSFKHALPQGHQAIFGLDVFDQSAWTAALTGDAQLASYKPVLRRIMETSHAQWAARGGAISLAVNSKHMVFHAVLAVLLGLDESDVNDVAAWHADVDAFVSLLRGSPHAPPYKVMTLRDRLQRTVVAPAVAASRARIAATTARPCILDVVVAASPQFDDAELHAHVLYMLVRGLPTIDAAVVNTITAICVFPTEHTKLVAAWAAFLSAYPTANDRWAAHLGDSDYLTRFLKQVKRFYGGAVHVARASVDVTLTNDDGNDVTIPVGALAVVDSSTTPDAFRPDDCILDCAIDMGASDAIQMLVLESALMSLLDYEWKMIPLQDYTIGDGHVPVGGLMAVNFHRRHRATNEVFQVAGSEADWRLLSLPAAQKYKDDKESLHAFFADTRLDLWTHLMIQLLQTKQSQWVVPEAATVLSLPKYQKVLPKIRLMYTEIDIPTEDEDTPLDPWYEAQLMKRLRDQCPLGDESNFASTWLPGEDMEAYILGKIGKIWPRVNVHWNDRYSDRALGLLIFAGLGQHLVEKLPEAHADDGSYYIVPLDFMHVLDVRPGYAKYGADGYFDQHGHVTKIVRRGATYRAGDDQWEYVKMCFRGSVNTKITALDHLLGLHSTVANFLTTASREQLPVDHPLRRLVKPFTFRSVVINYSASWALFWPNGMLQRGFALSEDGMKQTWAYGWTTFRFETFPEHKARQNIDTINMPFHQDGMAYWHVVRKFVGDYLDLYYSSDEAVAADVPIQAFWAFFDAKLPITMRALTLDTLKDFVAQCIVWVSGMHNHLGTLAEYVSDPAFCPSAWVEGELANRPGNAVRNALIMAATGFKQPSILEDFSHVMLDEEAKAVCRAFTADLEALVVQVDARNATREQPYVSFNPKTIEMAVSI